MDRKSLRKSLLVAAGIVAVAGAALGARARSNDTVLMASAAPSTIEPFALAQVLSQAPPDIVVISLDDARHPLIGAVPSSMYGESDDAFVASAPKARRIVLAGKDQVRVDRVARRLQAAGRSVAVLAGGIDAWDKAMDADPAAPADTAGAEAWEAYRVNVALRRYFGDASAAPPPAAAPRPAAAPAAPAAPKKREGC